MSNVVSIARSVSLLCGLILTMVGCALVSGCVKREDLVVWRAQLSSPDGVWEAQAETLQNGGFGNAHIDTTVYLKRTRQSSAAVPVLALDCAGPVPRPYTLDNEANVGGTVHLTMKWITPTRLLLTFDSHPTVDLETVRYTGVSIDVRDLSDHG